MEGPDLLHEVPRARCSPTTVPDDEEVAPTGEQNQGDDAQGGGKRADSLGVHENPLGRMGSGWCRWHGAHGTIPKGGWLQQPLPNQARTMETVFQKLLQRLPHCEQTQATKLADTPRKLATAHRIAGSTSFSSMLSSS